MKKILVEFFKHFQQEKIDLNLSLTESYEELLISIRDAAEAIIPEKDFLRRSLFGKIKNFVPVFICRDKTILRV